MDVKSRKNSRRRRHFRVRKKVNGTAERPRLAVMVSGKHIYAQVIDDEAGVTLASSSTASSNDLGKNVGSAQKLGKALAEAAVAKGICAVVIDRGGFKFHGRVKALVDGAVEGGLRTKAKEEE